MQVKRKYSVWSSSSGSLKVAFDTYMTNRKSDWTLSRLNSRPYVIKEAALRQLSLACANLCGIWAQHGINTVDEKRGIVLIQHKYLPVLNIPVVHDYSIPTLV